MKAIILTIGDELLNGQTVDTNSAYISNSLNDVGIRVFRKISIPDDGEVIKSTLDELKESASLILMTGGLGPTLDDITKKALAEYFESELVLNQDVLNYIESLFAKRGLPVTDDNKHVAFLPSNSRILHNSKGTAQGMWFEKDETVFISMPGVPYEMKAIMEESAMDAIVDHFKPTRIYHRHLRSAAVPETIISERIKDIETSIPENIGLAYLPNIGQVKIRLSADTSLIEQAEDKVDEIAHRIVERMGIDVYADENIPLEEALGRLLAEEGKSISTAESCTGGYISHKIISVSGSSRYFMGAVVAYDNEVKIRDLGVSRDSIIAHGAVSEEVAREMLLGVMDKMKTDYGIAVSGIMGPTGAVEGKPLGTVWIAYGSKEEPRTELYQLGKYRDINIEHTTVLALNLLRKFILARIE